MAPSEEINIPQKPPMVMVDRLVGIVDKTTETAFLVREDNVFCINGEFREPGLIENMAQTAAAGVGAKPGNSGGKAPLGFIGGIRNLKIDGFPRAGQEIITRVTVLHEVFDATIVQGEVFLEGRLIAGCELKIFLINT
ncbi:MAG: 3-hydroxyacyl-ACP dehydratase [Bacteroidetes bacterium]|nr:3-hydroxyacyl-ACP dehydratase [Bacteroidota bacterium]